MLRATSTVGGCAAATSRNSLLLADGRPSLSRNSEPHWITKAGKSATAPLRASERSIRAFITESRDWILKHQQRMTAEAERHASAKQALANLSPTERRTRERQERRQLLADAQALLPRWESALGVRASGLAIRAMRSRWGSCNTRTAKITLSLALAQQAPEILEAIVVHELAHLRVPHHGPAFKALMDEHLPDWRLRRKKMRDSTLDLFS